MHAISAKIRLHQQTSELSNTTNLSKIGIYFQINMKIKKIIY